MNLLVEVQSVLYTFFTAACGSLVLWLDRFLKFELFVSSAAFCD